MAPQDIPGASGANSGTRVRPLDRRDAAPPVLRPLVVLVDDDPAVLQALRRALRDEPVELRTTTDPEEVIDWVRREDVRVVMADYRIPGLLSGATLLQIVKAASPATRRLMLTAWPDDALVRRAGEMGLMETLAKPWDDEELRRRIREALSPRDEE
ncbi:MAG TPA: response regulator [Planctomycetota bacterium]|nr:response regulator [Planctomycetota bacterium]